MVEIKNLTGGYPHNEVFRDFSLSFPKGRFSALIGPNGSGKSTLFKLILKTLPVKSGDIWIQGKNVKEIRQREIALLLAFMPQYFLIPEGFTVLETVMMAGFAGKPCTKEDAINALKRCDCLNLKDRIASELSGGEAQIVMLARAIACATDLIIMDEPTSNLDINRVRQIMRIAKELTAEGKTVICAIHDLNSALHYADYAVVLRKGQVYRQGKPEEIIDSEMLSQVFGTDSRIIADPETGKKVVLV